jgi:hypothetical protein
MGRFVDLGDIIIVLVAGGDAPHLDPHDTNIALIPRAMEWYKLLDALPKPDDSDDDE